jgi:hypothetical protein
LTFDVVGDKNAQQRYNRKYWSYSRPAGAGLAAEFESWIISVYFLLPFLITALIAFVHVPSFCNYSDYYYYF